MSSAVKIRTHIADRAVAWLNAELPSFDPFHRAISPPEPEQTALVEVALAAMTLRRHSARFAIHPAPMVWLEYINNVYSRPAFYETVLRGHKHAFSGHLLLWIALSHIGLSPPLSRKQIQTLIDCDSVIASERTPFRLLELRYLLDLGGFRHHLPELRDLGQLTFLQSCFNPIDAMIQDIYALTHAVFYLSDFGRKPILTEADGTRDAVKMLLVMMVQRRNWDLVAELLLALYCLGGKENAFVSTVWHALAQAQTASGEFPEGPEGMRADANNPHDRFLALYHRTITALLAAALAWQEKHL